MVESIDQARFCRMLLGAVEQIRANHEHLSRLDSAVGDGDHGTTILRAMEAVEKIVRENPGPDLHSMFSNIAWAVMSCDGGSTGPLLGSFFMGLSEAAAGKSNVDTIALASLVESGVSKMQKQTRAKVGDKTMMDAFLPALEALRSSAAGNDACAALQAAAQAAAQGAEATKNMRAKFGRAKNLGDRVLGHPDPGAVSISLIFKGLSDGCSISKTTD